MIGQGGATGGQGRINFLRGGSDPIALSFWPDCSFQIVAQSSGKRVFVSRRGLDPVKRAMMTGPVIDGLAKSGRFAVERGEGRLCRRKSGFGGTPRFRGDGARELGRASCRERVLQYVSTSVVAVSLKTKTRNRAPRHQRPHA